MNDLLLLAVASLFAANAVLQLGLGLREVIASRKSNTRGPLIPAAAMAASGIIAWPVFFFVIAPLTLGALEPFLLFPLCSLVSVSVERFGTRKAAKPVSSPTDGALSAFDGLAFGSAYLALRFASTAAEAVVVSFGAALGFLASAVLLDSIRRRAETEAVPPLLRGAPLILISAGLLALLSLLATVALFAAIGPAR